MSVYYETKRDLIATQPSGIELGITTHKFRTDTSGKCVYIQSGLHGGEITYWIQERLNKILRDELVSGTVTLCPCANPIAWQQRNYFYTHGKFDTYNGKDFNRNGTGNHLGNLAEKTTNILYNIASKHDLCIDLHTSRNCIPFSIFSSDVVSAEIEALGLKYNYLSPPTIDEAFDDTLMQNNHKAFTIECGSHDAYEEEFVDIVTNGICRILKLYGMINNAHKCNRCETVIFTEQSLLRASDGCYITFQKSAGEAFKKGDVLYTEHYPTNFNTKEIKADINGTILKTAPTHIFSAGDEVLHYIKEDHI